MNNLRIAGIVILLLGITLYFLTGEKFETVAGLIAGAGFGLFFLSFLKRSRKEI